MPQVIRIAAGEGQSLLLNASAFSDGQDWRDEGDNVYEKRIVMSIFFWCIQLTNCPETGRQKGDSVVLQNTLASEYTSTWSCFRSYGLISREWDDILIFTTSSARWTSTEISVGRT